MLRSHRSQLTPENADLHLLMTLAHRNSWTTERRHLKVFKILNCMIDNGKETDSTLGEGCNWCHLLCGVGGFFHQHIGPCINNEPRNINLAMEPSKREVEGEDCSDTNKFGREWCGSEQVGVLNKSALHSGTTLLICTCMMHLWLLNADLNRS